MTPQQHDHPQVAVPLSSQTQDIPAYRSLMLSLVREIPAHRRHECTAGLTWRKFLRLSSNIAVAAGEAPVCAITCMHIAMFPTPSMLSIHRACHRDTACESNKTFCTSELPAARECRVVDTMVSRITAAKVRLPSETLQHQAWHEFP